MTLEARRAIEVAAREIFHDVTTEVVQKILRERDFEKTIESRVDYVIEQKIQAIAGREVEAKMRTLLPLIQRVVQDALSETPVNTK